MNKLPLNLLYLKYFCDAVRSGSVSLAARLNHISQSAVSQGIYKLEESLNCSLISHQPNRFKVTEKGKQLYEQAKQIFQAIDSAESALEEKDGKITFGCTHSFAISRLSHYLKRSTELYPNLRLNFRLGNYFNIKEWIKKGVIDFGILLDNDDLSPFDAYPLFQGEFRLYVSKEVEDASSLPFLLDSDERIETNLLKSLYKKMHGKELPVLMEISSWIMIAKLVEERMGIGLFPDYLGNHNEKLKPIFPELNPMRYTLSALFEKNNTPSAHALQFLELFKQDTKQAPLPSLQRSHASPPLPVR